jgi:hypothetical protein
VNKYVFTYNALYPGALDENNDIDRVYSQMITRDLTYDNKGLFRIWLPLWDQNHIDGTAVGKKPLVHVHASIAMLQLQTAKAYTLRSLAELNQPKVKTMTKLFQTLPLVTSTIERDDTGRHNLWGSNITQW